MKLIHPLTATFTAAILSELNDALGVIASAAAIAYTVWEWRRQRAQDKTN